jgi:WD40 repeat protein
MALPLQIPGEVPALPEKSPGAAGARPHEPALVELTGDSMIFDPDDNQKRNDGKYVNASIESAAFSPDGKALVTGDYFGMVRVFDPGSGRRLIRFPASYPDQGQDDALAFSPDGRTIAVPVKGRGQVATMDPVSGRIVREMQTFLDDPRRPATRGLAFSPDGKSLAGGMDRSGETLLWDAASGRLLRAIPPQMIPGHRERGG